MEGCKQREVAAAAQEAGAVSGGYQSNGRSPSYPGNRLPCHPANQWSCSDEDGWRAGSGAETGTGGRTEAAKREALTESCPRVCLVFHFCLFPS